MDTNETKKSKKPRLFTKFTTSFSSFSKLLTRASNKTNTIIIKKNEKAKSIDINKKQNKYQQSSMHERLSQT